MSNEEQNAAHSFDKEEDDIRGYYEPDDRPQSMKDLAEKLRLEKQIELAELTRLRSELQAERELRKELVEGLDSLRSYYQRTQFPYKTQYEKSIVEAVESLIKKAKLNN